jgi:hypothetical protein
MWFQLPLFKKESKEKNVRLNDSFLEEIENLKLCKNNVREFSSRYRVLHNKLKSERLNLARCGKDYDENYAKNIIEWEYKLQLCFEEFTNSKKDSSDQNNEMGVVIDILSDIKNQVDNSNQILGRVEEKMGFLETQMETMKHQISKLMHGFESSNVTKTKLALLFLFLFALMLFLYRT